MISRAYYLATLLAVAAAVTSAHASSTNPDVVVSAEWLRAHASDPNLVIIAVDMPSMGDMPEGYTSGHIPGARVLDFHSIASGMGGDRSRLSSELVSPDSLRSIFESLGISNDSHIVVYSSARQPVLVTRTFFTLDYIGLGEHLSVLDGGLDAWKAAGGALEKGAPRRYTRGLLRTNPRMDVLASGARRLGIPVKLYDGSFEDWSKHSDYPVAKGNAPQ